MSVDVIDSDYSIVLTRPREQSAEVAFILSQYELVSLIMPTIEVQFTYPSEVEKGYLESLEYGSSWVVFTSANGVRSTAPFLREALGRARFAVQGEATARAFREAFSKEPDLISSRFTSDVFGEELAAHAQPDSYFLLPGPAVRSGQIASTLKQRGSRVEVWVSYETVPVEPDPSLLRRLQDRPARHICLFFSPSSFHSLLQVTAPQLMRKLHLVAFGPVTAAAIEQAGFVCRLHCRGGGMSALAEALREYVDALRMSPG